MARALSTSTSAARRVLAAVLVAGAFSACATSLPTPLPEYKQQLIAYHDSGRYYADVAKYVAKARKAVMQRASEPGKLAIVLDIDETSLDNFPSEVETGFCFDRGKWDVWVAKAEAKAIPATLELYRFARQRGIDVFFISGRKESSRAATEKNLRDVGYDDWARVDLKPDDYKGTTAPFKTARREQILADGYRIILNMGDQVSDLDGGAAEATVKLPNAWYVVP